MPPIVKLGGCGGGVSSSAIVTPAARCAPSFAQRGMRQRDRERLRRPRAPGPRGSGSRRAAARRPRRRSVTVVRGRPCSRCPPRPIPRCVVTVALALPFFPPVRVTSTNIGTPVDSSVTYAGALSCSRPALREAARGAAGRRQRLHRRLAEARRAAGAQALGLHERRRELLRVLDERLDRGLAAAIVDRLGVEADVHGEQLAVAHARTAGRSASPCARAPRPRAIWFRDRRRHRRWRSSRRPTAAAASRRTWRPRSSSAPRGPRCTRRRRRRRSHRPPTRRRPWRGTGRCPGSGCSSSRGGHSEGTSAWLASMASTTAFVIVRRSEAFLDCFS